MVDPDEGPEGAAHGHLQHRLGTGLADPPHLSGGGGAVREELGLDAVGPGLPGRPVRPALDDERAVPGGERLVRGRQRPGGGEARPGRPVREPDLVEGLRDHVRARVRHRRREVLAVGRDRGHPVVAGAEDDVVGPLRDRPADPVDEAGAVPARAGHLVAGRGRPRGAEHARSVRGADAHVPARPFEGARRREGPPVPARAHDEGPPRGLRGALRLPAAVVERWSIGGHRSSIGECGHPLHGSRST